LTLDEVASKTRIHPDFLKALEDGNFAKLPDQVFAKGFVRSYARSLGLDEEDAIRRFTDSAGTFYNKQDELERHRQEQAENERRKRANRKVVIAAVGVALLALVLLLNREQSAVGPTRPSSLPEPPGITTPGQPTRTTKGQHAGETGGIAGGRGTETQAGASPGPPESVTHHVLPGAPGPSETGSVVVPASPTPPPPLEGERQDTLPLAPTAEVPSEGLPQDTALAREAPLVLELEALELTWVVVQVDGGGPQEALLRRGDRVKWKATDQFLVTLGNAGGVRVQLNGKTQGPFGPSGRVARDIVLKRGG
jgi:hypothetical protein